jgi:pimeloyl-ACP methyl ester carboxylesterase
MANDASIGGLKLVRAGDGTSLQHEVLGAGEPMLFLHGGFAGRDTFARQHPLAERFRLVLCDLRGHNGAEALLPPEYGFETTEAADLIAVLDAEGIERASLVGHSSGGAVAFAFTRRHPERVGRLVLLEPTLFSLLPPDLLAQERAFYEGLIALAKVGQATPATHAVVAHIAGEGWEARARPAAIAQVEAAAPMLAAHLRALLALQVTPDDVRSLAAPALVVHGRRSLPFYAAIFARLRELRPDWHFLALDAGHTVHLQRAAEVNAAITEFLTN